MKRRGRPKKADAPIIPWDEVDKLLVFGETVTDEASGIENRAYPSLAELARRYGVSKARMWKFSSERSCFNRRKEAANREQIRYEQKVIEKRAEARALSTDEELQIIDDYLRGFKQALAEGKIRYDNPTDFNTMSRLKEFKQGHADSRQEIQGMVSLEEIQARHRRLRDQLDGMDEATTGTVAPEDGEPSKVASDVGDSAPSEPDSGEAVH